MSCFVDWLSKYLIYDFTINVFTVINNFGNSFNTDFNYFIQTVITKISYSRDSFNTGFNYFIQTIIIKKSYFDDFFNKNLDLNC